MANLIIKSSADDLVLQGSDASPAITVGATGTTTFAENATLSGTANVYGAGTFPAHHIIQVLSTVKTDSQSTHNSTNNVLWTDITGLSRAITPVSTSNKILINFNVTYGSNSYAGFFRIQRKIASGSYADLTGATGDASGSRSRITAGAVGGTADTSELSTASMMYLDSPSTTSQVTYKIQYTSRHTDYMMINRGYTNTDADYAGLGISTITCMEVVG